MKWKEYAQSSERTRRTSARTPPWDKSGVFVSVSVAALCLTIFSCVMPWLLHNSHFFGAISCGGNGSTQTNAKKLPEHHGQTEIDWKHELNRHFTTTPNALARTSISACVCVVQWRKKRSLFLFCTCRGALVGIGTRPQKHLNILRSVYIFLWLYFGSHQKCFYANYEFISILPHTHIIHLAIAADREWNIELEGGRAEKAAVK